MTVKYFDFDVFLMYSIEDKDKVRPWAEKLAASDLNVWFQEWRPQPIGNINFFIEKSRALVFFLSSKSLAEWNNFESQVLPFRDPLNRERRFVPVRLDQAETPKSIADLLLISLDNSDIETSANLLIDACTPLPEIRPETAIARKRLNLGQRNAQAIGPSMRAMALSKDGTVLLVARATQILTRYLNVRDSPEEKILELSHAPNILAWDKEKEIIAAASSKKITVISDYKNYRSILDIDTNKDTFTSLTISAGFVAAGQTNGMVRLWETTKGTLALTLRGHTDAVTSIVINSKRMLTSSEDRTVRYWDIESRRCIRVFEGHAAIIRSVASTFDQRYAISGDDEGSIRQWDLVSGMCVHLFVGHTAKINKLSWSRNERFFASAADDRTVRIWDCVSGHCKAVLDGHQTDVRELEWLTEIELVAIDSLEAKKWKLESALQTPILNSFNAIQTDKQEDQVLYTNAKVLLVGESGAGKTGLSKRLALNLWELSSSTVGAWATQWKLPLENALNPATEKEIWLWDFGGQADQRLIHQLYIDETSLVVLVFDGQKSDVFDALNQWDNDLQRASKSEFIKILAAGRVDASPLRVSKSNLDSFVSEKGYKAFFETSALTGNGCQELKDAVLKNIDWDRIPWRSSPRLFKLLKDEIVSLKDQGKILMRFNDLREMLVLKMHGKSDRFSDAQLKSVLSLLTGPGVISELAFGGWILFQPQLINVYAQAVLHTMLEDQSELGSILESDVLAGNLSFHGLERVPDDETFILLAMHHALLERGLCAREMTEQGNVLVFPSYYKRQRPELKGHPAVLVSYTFDGFAPEIYSTLVVRLHHTNAFKRDNLWQDAADFRSEQNLQIGLKLQRSASGSLIEVYADPNIPIGEKIIFVRYVHEHIFQRAINVFRRRHYVCQSCGHAIADLEAPAIRLKNKFNDMGCPACDYRITLLDEMEILYSSNKTIKSVQVLDDSVAIELDNESKERLLVGEVISTAALANQICREKNISDHGIDAEIEFKNQLHEATGSMVYLQLKSGDSYLRTLADGKEIFTIKKPRHAEYWMDQNCPVMLVIRSSTGEVRWMEIRQYLKDQYKERRADAKSWGRSPDDPETLPNQIEFIGEKFDARSILKWRDFQLGPKLFKGKQSRKKS